LTLVKAQVMLFQIHQYPNLMLIQVTHLTNKAKNPCLVPPILLLMMSMHNPKTTIQTSSPILHLMLIQQKHHPLMKPIFQPYHAFMIIQALTCLTTKSVTTTPYNFTCHSYVACPIIHP
jgi:hypothetical protein